MSKLEVGDRVPRSALRNLAGATLELCGPASWTHLQFRRYAGCPVCNLHLDGFRRRIGELTGQGLREIAVFHSRAEELRGYVTEAPFDFVADPEKTIYREFGVETSKRAGLHPAVWWDGLRGFLRHRVRFASRKEGVYGLPADFLIGPGGLLHAVHYGTHASDHWSVDEVLRLAAESRERIRAAGATA